MESIKLCEYGCGQEAKYQLKNGKWCCEGQFQKCPENKKKYGKKGIIFSKERNKKISDKLKGRTFSYNHILNLNKSMKNKKNRSNKLYNSLELCSYGCGKPAKFYFYKVKKYCCSDFYMKCPSMHKKTMDSWRNIHEIETNKICSYGCNKPAHYLFKNGKYCCSSNHSSCSFIRHKNSEKNKIKQAGENNARFGVIVTKETKRKIRLGNNKDRENKYGRICPNYNKKACKLIDEYGIKNNYNFQHAENGGEFYIKELGYWVDGYDKEKNTVIEIDEIHHFDLEGNLKTRDINRENEIKEFLKCQFIRIKNL